MYAGGEGRNSRAPPLQYKTHTQKRQSYKDIKQSSPSPPFDLLNSFGKLFYRRNEAWSRKGGRKGVKENAIK